MKPKAKILIVDDEKPLRDTLARWFRPSYDCITAPDAEDAMKQVAGRRKRRSGESSPAPA